MEAKTTPPFRSFLLCLKRAVPPPAAAGMVTAITSSSRRFLALQLEEATALAFVSDDLPAASPPTLHLVIMFPVKAPEPCIHSATIPIQ
jgi:hypothetical protein